MIIYDILVVCVQHFRSFTNRVMRVQVDLFFYLFVF